MSKIILTSKKSLGYKYNNLIYGPIIRKKEK